MFGDPREMVLHYFLADDTVEIREIIPSNSGRDAVPLFLRRQRLPKVIYEIVLSHLTILKKWDDFGYSGMFIS